MQNRTSQVDRLAAALRRAQQAATLVFCVFCAVLPTNLSGPFGALASSEAEETTEGQEEATIGWSVAIEQSTRRAALLRVAAPKLARATILRSRVSEVDHRSHRGALEQRNGCGAFLLL